LQLCDIITIYSVVFVRLALTVTAATVYMLITLSRRLDGSGGVLFAGLIECGSIPAGALASRRVGMVAIVGLAIAFAPAIFDMITTGGDWE